MEVSYGSSSYISEISKGRSSGRPVMLEVLDIFSFITPSSIQLKKLRFKKGMEEKETSNQTLNGKGYHISVEGEIASGGMHAAIMLQNYLLQLRNQNFFEGISLTSNSDTDGKQIQFQLRATL